MNVIFGGTRYTITAPEDSWGFIDLNPCCTKCGDALRFVFVTGTEADVSTAASYQNPKAVRCRCFVGAESTRDPIPLEPCVAAVSLHKASETTALVISEQRENEGSSN
jgi:hypothetical protein